MKKKNLIKEKSNERNSSVELLKVIGIFLIVLSHVIQTLHSPNDLVGIQDYVVDLSMATTNIQYLILAILRSCGAIGNTIFFICSAWFLLDSSKANKKKILQMLLDIWVVSMLIFISVYFLRDGNISLKMIIKSMLPTTLENNWYMTCYLLFYPIHPFLNWLIDKMKQNTLFRTSFIMSILYIGVNFFQDGHFFSSTLILWITIYFVIAYIKNYIHDFSDNIKINTILFVLGLLGNCGIILLTNFLGLRVSTFSNMLLRWESACNPFIILMVIGMLNIARNIQFKNSVINYISNLSLLIYIIHENILLITYYRPLMWQYVYKNMGYCHILLWTFVLVGIVFTFGLVMSILYKNTIQKCVTKFVNFIYPILSKFYINIETKLLSFH